VSVFLFPGGGGGGGGPIGSSTATAETIDLTDGTWSLWDDDGLIDTSYGTSGVTFDAVSGENTIKMAALTVGSQNYMPASGTTHRWPRYYKNLVLSDRQALPADTIVSTVEMSNNATPAAWARVVVCGICSDATQTNKDQMDGSGGLFRHGGGASNPFAYGVWMLNAQTSGQNLSLTRGISTITRSNQSIGSGTYICVQADQSALTSGSRNSNFNQAASTGVQQIVGIGTYATGSIAAGSLVTMKIKSLINVVQWS